MEAKILHILHTHARVSAHVFLIVYFFRPYTDPLWPN